MCCFSFSFLDLIVTDVAMAIGFQYAQLMYLPFLIRGEIFGSIVVAVAFVAVLLAVCSESCLQAIQKAKSFANKVTATHDAKTFVNAIQTAQDDCKLVGVFYLEGILVAALSDPTGSNSKPAIRKELSNISGKRVPEELVEPTLLDAARALIG